MKNLKSVSIGMLFLAILFSVSSNVYAQMGHGKDNGNCDKGICANIPDLTSNQEAQMEKLKVVQMRKMLNYCNQIDEMRARLQTIRTGDNVDMKAINKIIDEMSVIRVNKQKDKEQHLQDVRNLLTDTQKVYFDKNLTNKGCGHKGMGCEKGMGSKHKKECNLKSATIFQ